MLKLINFNYELKSYNFAGELQSERNGGYGGYDFRIKSFQ